MRTIMAVSYTHLTHSPWATSWAQAGRGIPCYGTTHADYLYGQVPCVRTLTKEEIETAYEKNTGVLIADEFERLAVDYLATPAVLCKNHGPFTWGKDAKEAVHNAVVLEEVAKMAARCEQIDPKVNPAPQELQDKHYYRKHGKNAYYCLLYTSQHMPALIKMWSEPISMYVILRNELITPCICP